MELVFRQDGITGDTVEFGFGKSGLSICTDEPWAGDTYSGFGRRGYAELTVEQARELHAWLTAKLLELAP